MYYDRPITKGVEDQRREIRVLDGSDGPELPIVDGDGAARAIVWPGTGARSRSLHHLRLSAGSGTIDLAHPSDAVYYVIAGTGSVLDAGAQQDQKLRAGSMFHVDAGTRYAVRAGDDGIELVGGPAPADDDLYAHLGA
jgi:mannose-6-phosphate isomerase-like protein (cupin superfamily)